MEAPRKRIWWQFKISFANDYGPKFFVSDLITFQVTNLQFLKILISSLLCNIIFVLQKTSCKIDAILFEIMSYELEI